MQVYTVKFQNLKESIYKALTCGTSKKYPF